MAKHAVLVVTLVVALSAVARAQTPSRAAFGGAVVFAHQTDGKAQPGTVSDPPEGNSRGVTVFGAVRVSRFVSVGGELSTAGEIENTNVSSHPSVTFTTTARHRDTILSGLVRIHPARFVDIVAGAGIAWGDTIATVETRSFYAPVGWTTTTRTQSLGAGRRLALTSGADVPIPVSRHVAVMPTVRFHYISRPTVDPSTLSSTRPVSPAGKIVFRAGGGIQVTF